jgi:predicted NBD/HSP70 family sugar kinase
VTVENDAKASALAELLLGKYGLSFNNVIFLSVGHGIGTGIVVDNHILSGSSHAAGEFGHMTIVEGGALCSCGNRGCWEMYASDRATIDRYVKHGSLIPDHSVNLTMNDVLLAVRNGDHEARRALTTTAEYLGLGIANIIRSIDPELIIIGGSITQMWDFIYEEIMMTVQQRGYLGSQLMTKIFPTSLPDHPALLGAAALSIRKIFDDQRIAL